MNTETADELNAAFSDKLHAEVELRAQAWLNAAMGADWTKLLTDTIKDRDGFKAAWGNALASHDETLGQLRDAESVIRGYGTCGVSPRAREYYERYHPRPPTPPDPL